MKQTHRSFTHSINNDGSEGLKASNQLKGCQDGRYGQSQLCGEKYMAL